MDLSAVLGWVGSSLGLASRSVPPIQIILHIYEDKKEPKTAGWDLLFWLRLWCVQRSPKTHSFHWAGRSKHLVFPAAS